MKPSLQLKLTQHLALTPQLQQSIRLLQLSTIELEHELENTCWITRCSNGKRNTLRLRRRMATGSDDAFLRRNGRCRHARRAPLCSMTKAGWTTNRLLWFLRFLRRRRWRERLSGHPGGTVSLREHLLWQLGLMTLSDRDRVLVRCLVEALDDDGYLTQSLDELVEVMPSNWRLHRKSCRSRSIICSTLTRPASARAARRSACCCNSSAANG
jgi:RNA polymerase sigma-54 factor